MKALLARDRPLLRAAFTGAAIWIIVLGVAGPTFHRMYRLEKHGVQAEARVVLKQPREHWTVVFTFRHGDTQYTGSGSATRGGLPPMESIRIGDPVIITYDPRDPRNSSTGVAGGRFGPEFIGFVISLTFASAIAAVIVLVRDFYRSPPARPHGAR